jgi:hypothetical protein
MPNLLEYRVSKLVVRSDHYRRLAEGCLPEAVSAAILAMAEECEGEVARMERDCRWKKGCPCELFCRLCRPLE